MRSQVAWLSLKKEHAGSVRSQEMETPSHISPRSGLTATYEAEPRLASNTSPPLPQAPTVVGLVLLASAASLAGWLPLQLSVATLFLLAGPHNWMEFRYFVARMPVRWGASRDFFLIAIAGVTGLTLIYAALPMLASAWLWSDADWSTSAAVWNSLLILWIILLIHMRGRELPGRDWSLAMPIGFALVAVNWIVPQIWEIGLVYLHPLVALWFLDRQLRRSRPEWIPAYRRCLACLPIVLALLWLRLAHAGPLPSDNGLALRITQHAGAGILRGVSSHLLVATHVFLETIHYSIWIVILPIIGLRSAPWRTGGIPLVRHRLGWPRAVRTALAIGAFGVLLLWISFLADYSATRDLYFTVAMLHVLAEAPFLLRMI